MTKQETYPDGTPLFEGDSLEDNPQGGWPEVTERDSFVVDCEIWGREGDGPLFVDGAPRLLGYTILPKEAHHALTAERDRYREALVEIMDVIDDCGEIDVWGSPGIIARARQVLNRKEPDGERC